jgi:hypothetical protein
MNEKSFHDLLQAWNEDALNDELTLRCARTAYEQGVTKLSAFFLGTFLARNPDSAEARKILELLGESGAFLQNTAHSEAEQVLSEGEFDVEDLDFEAS